MYTVTEIARWADKYKGLSQSPVRALLAVAGIVCKYLQDGNNEPVWELLTMIEQWQERWGRQEEWPTVQDVKEWLNGHDR